MSAGVWVQARLTECCFNSGDPTWGSWDSQANTLTMPLWHPGVWSWNDDFEGVKLFYSAWAMGMRYVFYFDEQTQRAEIKSPVLGGLITFTDFVSIPSLPTACLMTAYSLLNVRHNDS